MEWDAYVRKLKLELSLAEICLKNDIENYARSIKSCWNLNIDAERESEQRHLLASVTEVERLRIQLAAIGVSI